MFNANKLAYKTAVEIWTGRS